MMALRFAVPSIECSVDINLKFRRVFKLSESTVLYWLMTVDGQEFIIRINRYPLGVVRICLFDEAFDIFEEDGIFTLVSFTSIDLFPEFESFEVKVVLDNHSRKLGVLSLWKDGRILFDGRLVERCASDILLQKARMLGGSLR